MRYPEEYEPQDKDTLRHLISDPDWDCDQRWRAWCLLVDHAMENGIDLQRKDGGDE